VGFSAVDMLGLIHASEHGDGPFRRPGMVNMSGMTPTSLSCGGPYGRPGDKAERGSQLWIC
jgi:hypothetical protein